MNPAADGPSRGIERGIALGIAVAVGLVIALGALCLFALRRSVALDHEAFERANSVVAFGAVRGAFEAKMNAFRSFLSDPRESALPELDAARAQMRSLLASFEQRSTPQERKLLQRIRAAEEDQQAVLQEAIARRRAGESRDSVAAYLVAESGSRRSVLEEAIGRFLQFERADVDELARLSREQNARTATFVAAITVIAVALIVIAGASLVRRLARSFRVEFEQRHRAEAAEARSALLAEASEVLGSSLDYRTTLTSVARLAVPRIADWCFVDMIEDGHIGRVAVAHRRPEDAALARDLEEQHLLDPDARQGPPHVLRTGEAELLDDVPSEFLKAIARTPEAYATLLRMDIRSYMCVPIRARGEILGILTFCSSRLQRGYTKEDLRQVEDIARRSGVAIDNARLYRDAREAIYLRDDFLSIASHELKTPIATLQIQIQSLIRRTRASSDPSSQETLLPRLATAERQIDRLTRLVNNLLDISRITAGRLDLQTETVNLEAVVREVLGRFSEELERAGCAASFRVEGSHVGLWDRTRIEQVVTNLLANAVKYGAGRPVDVALVADAEVSRLTVRDHGIGIAPEHQARIFDRFERAVSVRHYGGLGLGLWIVRQIVEALGGKISVESRPEEGSAFIVELPRQISAAAAERFSS